MFLIVLLMLLFSPFQASAKSADCSLKDKTFSIEDNTLPDKKDHSKITQNVTIKSANRQHSIVKNGKGEIGFIHGGDSSICTGTAAYILSESVVAILFGKSDPPFPDKLMMVVYDAKADRIIKTEKDLGTFQRIDVHPEGFIFSTMDPKKESKNQKMKSPDTGREMNAADEDLGAFQLVRMQKKRLTREFEPLISWDKTDYRRFFKDEKDYLETAGWDKKKRVFKKTIVFKASYTSRKEGEVDETCIQLAEKRDSKLDKKKWRCQKDR